MKKYCSILLFLLVASLNHAQFSNAELIATYSVAEIQSIANEWGVPSFVLTPEYDVDVYRIIYNTPDPHGNMTIATGAFCVPKGTCDFPIGSYQHGTTALRENVPSYLSGELNVGVLLATTGYLMCLPDYLGLGGSPGFHPYVHAKSQATASADLILASQEFANQQNIAYNEQVFLLGYSQGGHATMALHKELQENPAYGLTVTASFPLSGPYDVSGVQAEYILSDEAYATPGYLPYILFAYNFVYGTLFDEPSDIFAPPYDEILLPLFDGEHSMAAINVMCPSVPKLMFRPEVLDSFMMDSNHRFWVALRDNDLYDWTPQAPVRMYYCTGDEQVNYQNALVALDAFQQNEAPDVEAHDLGDGTHGECFGPAIFATKFGMDAYKAACTTSVSTIPKNLPVKVYPNPVQDYFQIEIEPNADIEQLLVYDTQGVLVYSFQDISSGTFRVARNHLKKGMYILKGLGKSNFQTKIIFN